MENSDATAGHRWYLQMILCAKLYLVVCDSLCLATIPPGRFFARRFEDVNVWGGGGGGGGRGGGGGGGGRGVRDHAWMSCRCWWLRLAASLVQ